MIYADTTGQKSHWFLYDHTKVEPERVPYEMVGVDKATGFSITMKPGDFIQLTEVEIMGMHNRIIMKDGTLIRVDEKKMKELLKASMEGAGFSTTLEIIEETGKIEDDVELLNRAAGLESRAVLKRILNDAKKSNRGYHTIQKLEEMIEKATKR